MFEFSRQLIQHINTARTEPNNTSKTISNQFKDNFYDTEMHAFGKVIDTFEGVQALNDLSTYLANKSSINPLNHSKALDQAAQMIADQKGRQGKVQNQSPKVIYETIKKFAGTDGKIGQLVSLSASTPNQIATYFLIDDGLTSRKRRRMLLDSVYKYVGVGHAAHSQYQTVTVILLAEVLDEKDNYFLENSRLTEQIKKDIESQVRERESASYIPGNQIRESEFY